MLFLIVKAEREIGESWVTLVVYGVMVPGLHVNFSSVCESDDGYSVGAWKDYKRWK